MLLALLANGNNGFSEIHKNTSVLTYTFRFGRHCGTPFKRHRLYVYIRVCVCVCLSNHFLLHRLARIFRTTQPDGQANHLLPKMA